MIELVKENLYLGFWVAAIENGDFFAVVWKTPNGPWEWSYRFRYHRDDKVFNSDDEKVWYKLKALDGSDKSKERLKKAMNSILELGLISGMIHSGSYVECMGDSEAMLALLMSGDRPYFHIKQIKVGGK